MDKLLVTICDHQAAIAALDQLLPHSPRHRDWPRADVQRCLHSPIIADQYLLLFDAGDPVGFMTWGWLSPEAESGYVTGTRLLQPSDFPKTSENDVLWVVDLIAPFGHVMQLCRFAQQVLSSICPGARMRRGKDTQGRRAVGRVGYFPAKRAVA